MKRYVRALAIVCTGSVLAFWGVVNAQRPDNATATPLVTWKDASGTLPQSNASAGSQVVKDADTGRLRAAQPGELPPAPTGRPTQIIDLNGGGIAIAGDDLMNESIAVKNADGSISVTHRGDAKTHPEVK